MSNVLVGGTVQSSGVVLVDSLIVSDLTGSGINTTISSIAVSGDIVLPASPVFLALGIPTNSSNSSIQYSSDGSNWSNSSNVFVTAGNGAAWNGAMWVAVGDDSTPLATIKHSSDGVTWSNSISGGFGRYGTDVVWNGAMWVATGADDTNSNTIQSSTDGLHWVSTLSGGFGDSGEGVVWTGSRWYAVGVNVLNSTTPSKTQYSVDGRTWLGGMTGDWVSNNSGSDLGWNGNVLINVGNTVGAGGSIKYSTDGSTLSDCTLSDFTTAANGVAWNGSMWVAVGEDASNAIKYSSDGIIWTDTNSSSSNVYDVTWDGTKWLAVGIEGSLQTSTDGSNWISKQIDTLSTVYCIRTKNVYKQPPSTFQTTLQRLESAVASRAGVRL